MEEDDKVYRLICCYMGFLCSMVARVNAYILYMKELYKVLKDNEVLENLSYFIKTSF